MWAEDARQIQAELHVDKDRFQVTRRNGAGDHRAALVALDEGQAVVGNDPVQAAIALRSAERGMWNGRFYELDHFRTRLDPHPVHRQKREVLSI